MAGTYSYTFTRPYCTLREVCYETDEALLPDDLSTLSDKEVRNFDELNRAIDLASRQVDRMTGRDFWLHDHTSDPLVVDPDILVSGTIYLPFPVIFLSGVTEAGAAMPSGTFRFWGDESSAMSFVARTSTAGNALRGLWGSSYSTGVEGSAPALVSAASGVRNDYWRGLVEDGLLTLSGRFGFPLATKDDGTPDDQQPPPTLPGPVRRAAILIAAAWSGRNRKEFRSPDGSVASVLDENIPKEVQTLLTAYTVEVI